MTAIIILLMYIIMIKPLPISYCSGWPDCLDGADEDDLTVDGKVVMIMMIEADDNDQS